MSPSRVPSLSASRVERILARLFVLTCGLAVALLLGLGVDRLCVLLWGYPHSGFERDFPRSVVRLPTPYSMFTNYRRTPPSGPKPAGERRVALLGGSTVWMGDPTLAEMLEERLTRSGGGRVTVVNYGVASQVSGQELARLVFDVAGIEPDLVVMYSGGNDLIHAMTGDPRPGYPFNFFILERHPYLLPQEERLPMEWWWVRQTYLGRRWADDYFADRIARLPAMRRAVNYGSQDWTDRVAGAYLSHVSRAQRVSSAWGARYLAAFQPMIFYKDKLAPAEEGCFGHEFMRAHCLRGRDQVREGFAELAEGQGLAAVDLSDLFDDLPGQVFTDSIHITQGHFKRVADALSKAIDDHRLLPAVLDLPPGPPGDVRRSPDPHVDP